MTDLTITKYNEAYLQVACDRAISTELQEYFAFYAPNYKFMPSFKSGFWDGRIRLFDTSNGAMYTGLFDKLIEFATDREYEVEIGEGFATQEYSLVEAKDEIQTYGLPGHITPHDYQEATYAHCIRKKRGVMLSPTSSGKSLMIYLLTRYYLKHTDKKILIIVPDTTLVEQMTGDFADYGFDVETNMHKIYSGKEKITEKRVVISTWQSAYKLNREWFAQFGTVFGDEAHTFKAKSLVTLMTKLCDCSHRFGFTGTLDDIEVNKLVLEGLFGPVKKVTTTKELMDRGIIAQLKVKCLLLVHPEPIRKVFDLNYREEIEYIMACTPRNNFIKNLALSLKGNTLVLFREVEMHGKILNEMISKEAVGRNVYYVHGKVKTTVRNEIRTIIEKEDDAIIVASSVFATGISIKKINNMIFAYPSKGKIKILQSIGRGLRKSSTKTICKLYDIADDFSWKKKKNTTLNHFLGRVKIYIKEKFKYTPYTIDLEY